MNHDAQAKITVRERAIAIGAIALPVLLLVWLHVAVVTEWRDARRLAADGIAVDAQVVGLDAVDVPRSEGYRVTYEYPVAAGDDATTVRSATSAVDRATYEALEVGGVVEVRYDTADPSRVAVSRNDRFATMVLIAAVVDGMVVAAALVIVRTARRDAKPAV